MFFNSRSVKYLKIIVFLFLQSCIVLNLHAQQKPEYSQYMFNIFLINPAAAGSDGFTSLNITERDQWVGLPNAPTTHSFSIQSRVLKNSFIAKALSLRKKFSKRSASGRVGVGAYFYSDKNGPIGRTGAQLTYAYHIPLRQSQLSFGISAEPYVFSVDKTMLRYLNSGDPVINNIQNRGVFDGNFGAQFTTPFINAGLSVTDIFKSSIHFGDNSTAGLTTERSYNLIGSYKIEINRFFLAEPSTLIKVSESGAFQMDLGGRVYYREDYWSGLSYRTAAGGGTIIFLLGMRVNKYYFGYAFDYLMSPIMTHTLGTHEFMLALKFGENARRYRWLNRY
jgi:type IX secretion system PorP/SprF family membrane protein